MSDNESSAAFGLLRQENLKLRERIVELETRLEYLDQHQTLARGMAGEKLVSELIGGILTVHTASSDLIMESGQLIEIKRAKVTIPSKISSGGRRWQWQKVFGETNEKAYDYLILVGETDSLYRLQYPDPAAPYIIFCVPRNDVSQLTTAGTRGARGILLSTNPQNTSGKSGDLWRNYVFSAAELTEKFGKM